MMFFRRTSTPPPVPAWLKLALAAVFLYAFGSYAVRHFSAPQDPKDPPQERRDFSLPELPASADFSRLLPDIRLGVRVKEVSPGSGEGIYCGQKAATAMTAQLQDGTMLDLGALPQSFILGAGHVPPGLEMSMAGMRRGGMREIALSYGYGFGAPGFERPDVAMDSTVIFRVSLNAITPPLPEKTAPSVRRYDLLRGTAGDALLCGSVARVHLAVWDVEGKQIYTSRTAPDSPPLSVRIGASSMFYGLEAALQGITPGSRMLLLVPPAFQKPLQPDAASLVKIPFPLRQTVIVEVEILP